MGNSTAFASNKNRLLCAAGRGGIGAN